ncbi:unnamed protein product, partial [Prorocentrum cordatum]
ANGRLGFTAARGDSAKQDARASRHKSTATTQISLRRDWQYQVTAAGGMEAAKAIDAETHGNAPRMRGGSSSKTNDGALLQLCEYWSP